MAHQFACGLNGCNETFTKKDNLYRHFRTRHANLPLGDFGAGWVRCDICQKPFSTGSALKAHRKACERNVARIGGPNNNNLEVGVNNINPGGNGVNNNNAVENGLNGINNNVVVGNGAINEQVIGANVNNNGVHGNGAAAANIIYPAANAVNLAEALPFPTDSTWGDILSSIREPLYHLHHDHRAKFLHLCNLLLREATQEGAHDEIINRNIFAFLLLPGLVQNASKVKALRSSVKLVLADIQRSTGCKADYIIRLAAKWKITIDSRPRVGIPRASKAKVIAHIHRLCENGQLSRAHKQLEILTELVMADGHPQHPQPLPPPSTQELQDRVTALHPPRTDQDDLPDSTHDPLGQFVIEGNIVRKYVNGSREVEAGTGRSVDISRLKADSAPGMDGWTNKLLLQLSTHGIITQDASAFDTNLSRLFNLMYSNSLPEISRQLLVMVRSVLLPKPNGGYRPLGIASVIFRLPSRIAASHFEPFSGMSSMQLAITVKDGSVIGAQRAQLAYDNGDCLLSLDISNAFNITRHRPVYDALVSKPSLHGVIPFYRFAYGSSVELRGSSGLRVGSSETGLRQGDGLASLYFCLVIDPCLVAIDHLLQQEDNGPVRSASVSAFMDDVTIAGRPDLIHSFISHFLQVFENANLPINRNKCCFFGRQGEDFDLSDWDIPGATSFKILGAPIGPTEHRRVWIRDHIGTLLPAKDVLRLLSPRHAISLLTFCINPTVTYLMRAVAKDDLLNIPLQAFDQAIDDSIVEVLGVDKGSISFRMIRDAARREGGLGISIQAGGVHEMQCILGREATRLSLAEENPLAGVMARELQEIEYGSRENLSTAITGFSSASLRSILARQGTSRSAVLLSAKEYLQTCHRRGKLHQRSTVLAALREDPIFRSEAAWLTSLMGDGARTLSHLSAPSYLRDQMSDPEFRDTSRLLFGQPVVNDPPGHVTRCTCPLLPAPQLADRAQAHHPIACPQNQRHRKNVHDQIQLQLQTFFKAVRPGAVTESDPVVGRTPLANGEPGNDKVADLLVKLPDGTFFIIDVSVVDPAAAHYVTRASSHITLNGAAIHRENEKNDQYRGVITENGQVLNLERLVPFVVERTGRLGPAAMSFLNDFVLSSPPEVHATALRSKLLKSIAFWNAVYNGRMVGDTRHRALGPGQQDAGA